MDEFMSFLSSMPPFVAPAAAAAAAAAALYSPFNNFSYPLPLTTHTRGTLDDNGIPKTSNS